MGYYKLDEFSLNHCYPSFAYGSSKISLPPLPLSKFDEVVENWDTFPPIVLKRPVEVKLLLVNLVIFDACVVWSLDPIICYIDIDAPWLERCVRDHGI